MPLRARFSTRYCIRPAKLAALRLARVIADTTRRLEAQRHPLIGDCLDSQPDAPEVTESDVQPLRRRNAKYGTSGP